MNNKELIKPNDLDHLEVLFEIIKLDRAEQRQDNSDYVTGPANSDRSTGLLYRWEERVFLPVRCDRLCCYGTQYDGQEEPSPSDLMRHL